MERSYTSKLILLGCALSILLPGLLVAACGGGQPPNPQPERDYWPTVDWRIDAAVNHGLDERMLAGLRGEIEQDLPSMDSLLIIKDGYLVYEEYFNGYDANQTHHLHSVTKCFLSTLYGMAQVEGKIQNLDANLGAVLPDAFVKNKYQDKKRITLRHLLQMRSGLEIDEASLHEELLSFGGEEQALEYYLERDETDFALSHPLAHRPGAAWNYSSMDSQLLSAAFTALTGQSLAEYAGEKLFSVMGITNWAWPTDDRGVSIGGFSLQLTPRDMAKLGYLYLNRGRWDGQQVLPKSWVKLATSPQDNGYHAPAGQEVPIEWYGYHWWTWQPQLFGGRRAIVAAGYGGQRIVLIPDLDLLVVTTANPYASLDAAEESDVKVSDLIIQKVLPAVIDSPSPDPFWEAPAVQPPPGGALYQVGADGRGQRAILEQPGHSFWGPAWSPDGKQIAFSRGIRALIWPGSPKSEIYISNADGTNLRQLTKNGRNNFLPSWSPDGLTIAYISGLGVGWNSHEIFTVSVDTGQEARLTENDAQEYGVTWSPDGMKLAFGTKRAGEMQIYTMNPDGSEQQSLATPAAGHSPAWSPDGARLAYTAEVDGHSDIMLMDADGSNQRLLVGGPSYEYLPAWSPDGNRIAFTSTRDGAAAIYVVDAAGNGITKISGRNLKADVVTWSADGLYLVFNGAQSDTSFIAQNSLELLAGVILILIAISAGLFWKMRRSSS